MLRRLWILTLGVLVGLAALAGSAFASLTPIALPEKLECTPTAPCGSDTSMTPYRLAVNEETGEVYVIDVAHNMIQRFSATGKYEGQFGVAGFKFEANNQSCDDIAVDNSSASTKGNVYIESTASGKEVYAFDSSGTLLWEHGGYSEPCGIAVDSTGHLWLSDYNEGVNELSLAAGKEGEIVAGTNIAGPGGDAWMAFDGQGNVLITEWGGYPSVYDSSGQLVLKTVAPNGSGDNDVAVDTLNQHYYMVEEIHGVIEEVAGAGGVAEQIGSNFGPSSSQGIAVNTASQRAYVSHGSEVSVYDIFAPKLTVTTTGNGTGAVSCNGEECAGEYGDNEEVTLEASAGEGSLFAGWTVNGTAACPGSSTCKITLTADTTVEADFTLEERELTVSESGEGEVQSTPAGIECGATCSASFVKGEFVVLTAMAAPHSHFVAWSGCEAASGETCEVTLSEDKTVSAQFAPTMDKLALTLAGSGSGSVSCAVGVGPQEACASEYVDGTVVTVSGAAASGSTFVGLSGGGCSGTGACVLTLSGNTAITATFNAIPVEKAEEKPVEKAKEVPVEKAKEEPVENKEAPAAKKHRLTRGQRLARAIKQCKRMPKHKRKACIKHAKKKYGPKHKGHHKHGRKGKSSGRHHARRK